MSRYVITSSQTVGPFFHDCLMRDDARCDVLATSATEGVHIRVEGRVLDGDGVPVPDAVLELWQANRHGRFNHPRDRRDVPLDPSFTGFSRVATDAEGGFCITTIKPGVVPFDDHRVQAPHIAVIVLGRGLLNHLYTRIYFSDQSTNDTDPVLARVPAERRATLVAALDTTVDGPELLYRFDVILQGAGETVFFDFSPRHS